MSAHAVDVCHVLPSMEFWGSWNSRSGEDEVEVAVGRFFMVEVFRSSHIPVPARPNQRLMNAILYCTL